MKLTKYFMPLAAIALLASCSNDNVPTPDVEKPGKTPIEGVAYANFAISLPSTGGTKAGEYSYEDGKAEEFAVYQDVFLYLFTGDNATEATAEYDGIERKLVISNWEDESDHDDITKVREVTFELDDYDSEGDTEYYGLLVLNKGTGFKAPQKGNTLEQWLSASTNYMQDDPAEDGNDMIPTLGSGTTKYYTMTNAPVYSEGKVSTLVKFNKANIATSPEQAQDPVAVFFMQRGVAKVSVGPAQGKDLKSLDVTKVAEYEGKTPKVKVTNWKLDNTNQETFAVQRVTSALDTWLSSSTYTWFTAFNVSGATEKLVKHIWWGIDPNYSNADKSDSKYTADLTSIGTSVFGDDPATLPEYAYCLENTMDLDNMTKANTTRVVFKTQYLINGDGTPAVDFIVYPGNQQCYPVAAEDLAEGEITLDNEGKIKLSELLKSGDEDATLNKYLKALQMGSDAKVYYYKGGVSYFAAYIRHFNEVDIDDITDLTDVTYEEQHLGRYGVLRNNWYGVNVTKVNGYGYPVIPPDPDDPVDEEDPDSYNMYIEINILDWAKRDNDYELK